jgi:hypothetical protein
MEIESVVVQRADVEAAASRLTALITALPPAQKEVMGWLMQRAGFAPALLPGHFRYKPRGGSHLVVGGADGLLVTISRSGIHITPPEGPLPIDFVGVGVIPPEM